MVDAVGGRTMYRPNQHTRAELPGVNHEAYIFSGIMDFRILWGAMSVRWRSLDTHDVRDAISGAPRTI